MALADSYVKQEFSPELEREERQKAALLEEMGITQYETDKLKKMMLGADEAVCAKKEELERIRRHKGRKDYWEEFVDAKRRMGRTMHHSDIIRRLRRVLPSLIVCRGGQLNRIGLYIVRSTPVSEILNYPLATSLKYVDVPIFVSWLELGDSPEYEIDLVNDVDVAVGQRRGWRTLLLRLIARRHPHCKLCAQDKTVHQNLKGPKASVITEEQAVKAFGEPTNGPTAWNYRKQLYEFRNGLK